MYLCSCCYVWTVISRAGLSFLSLRSRLFYYFLPLTKRHNPPKISMRRCINRVIKVQMILLTVAQWVNFCSQSLKISKETYHQYKAPLSNRAHVYKEHVWRLTILSDWNSENCVAGCSNLFATKFRESSISVATFPDSVQTEHLMLVAEIPRIFSPTRPSAEALGWWITNA